MTVVSLEDVSLGFAGPPLLDGVTCHLQAGQRVGLVGRNGAGKSSFLRLLAGVVRADAGTVRFAPGTVVAALEQDVPAGIRGRIRDVVAAGYRDRIVDGDPHPADWRRDQATARMLSRTGLDGDAAFETLSTGMQRRVLFARALVAEPDLLLLDEPTNHLDIDAIGRLEDQLLRFPGAIVFVTHDRAFLRRVAERIVEIDRGRLFDWSCDYATFLERREAVLEAEEKQDALFDRRLAEEEIWIRTGIKARRTRNEGRVRALEAMRRQRASRREREGRANLVIQEAERSGTLVAALEGVAVSRGGRPVLRDVTATVTRGDRIGIIGPNGAGKTTLLGVLLGRLTADTGRVRLGTNLRIAYFDQLRDRLDGDASVAENVGDGYDTVKVGDVPRHVVGYLKEFLFTPERARTPVRLLSGGERNRVLLAKLFAKPANVIVLDEPTNDLDTETLEMLEERLCEFGGTVLVVSHDRAFLDNVVTSTLVFEPDGGGGFAVAEHAGGWSDWAARRAAAADQPAASKRESPRQPPEAQPARRRLSYREQQELAALPDRIEALEAERATILTRMAEPDYYRSPSAALAGDTARLQAIDGAIHEAMERWADLEARSAPS